MIQPNLSLMIVFIHWLCCKKFIKFISWYLYFVCSDAVPWSRAREWRRFWWSSAKVPGQSESWPLVRRSHQHDKEGTSGGAQQSQVDSIKCCVVEKWRICEVDTLGTAYLQIHLIIFNHEIHISIRLSFLTFSYILLEYSNAYETVIYWHIPMLLW